MSLFVNPTQFGAAADLDAYPRDEADDLAAAADAGVDLVFAPTVEEMYPPGFQTWVDVAELGSILEGEHRPGHFRGVATVCLKLFTIVRPDLVYFGQKDAQQVAVLRRMIADLALDARAARPADRQGRRRPGALVPQRPALGRRARARPALPRALATRDPERARELLDGLEVDYVEIAPFDPPVLAAAIHVGSTRLIDNVPLERRPHEHPPTHPRSRRTRPRQAPHHRAARHEGEPLADRDDHRLRRPVGPPGRRRRRGHDPRRRLRRDDDAGPRLDGARDDGGDARADARRHARRQAAARRRRHAVRLLPDLRRARGDERRPVRQGRRRRRRQARRRRHDALPRAARSSGPAFP